MSRLVKDEGVNLYDCEWSFMKSEVILWLYSEILSEQMKNMPAWKDGRLFVGGMNLLARSDIQRIGFGKIEKENRQYKIFRGCVSFDQNLHETMYSFLARSLSSHIWKFPFLGRFEANWLFHQKITSNCLIVNDGKAVISPTQDMISEAIGLYFTR